MIYRTQSLFLLGVVICMSLLLALPIWHETNPENTEIAKLNAYGLVHQNIGAEEAVPITENRIPLLIAVMAVLVIVVALAEIFQYKNRLTQIKLGALNALLMAAALASSWYFSYQAETWVAPQTQGNYDAGFFVLPIALLLNVLANRFIRRDDKLVRSVDRLR
jgi:hypothetical protein